ncbi:cell division protein ZapB [Solidesulfovibrio sp.]|uniref:cell division protein ZapB n=1 Tax=Solidesulfovibrio sp. TaxID=2910990 RepID=UPI00344D1AB9
MCRTARWRWGAAGRWSSRANEAAACFPGRSRIGMGMDIFDTLEDRVEKLLARKKALEEENAALRAEASRLADEKKAVADRIDGLLEKLQAELDS